jgi:hypothetical protein
MSAFREKKNHKKCTFGLSYDHIKPRVEIENKKIHTQVQFENVAPTSYTPAMNTIKKDQP